MRAIAIVGLQALHHLAQPVGPELRATQALELRIQPLLQTQHMGGGLHQQPRRQAGEHQHHEHLHQREAARRIRANGTARSPSAARNDRGPRPF